VDVLGGYEKSSRRAVVRDGCVIETEDVFRRSPEQDRTANERLGGKAHDANWT